MKEKTPELQKAFDNGYMAGYGGANIQNCHFSNFVTPERTAAWQSGNDLGSNLREKELKKILAQKKRAKAKFKKGKIE